MDWYAVFVETGKEEVVQQWLHFHYHDGTLHSIIPKKKVPEKRNGRFYETLRKLFPGYILINTEMDVSKYHTIRSIPKVIKLLGNGSDYSKISTSELSPILKLIGNHHVVDYSKVYIENSKVYVKDGPLKGMEGLIRKVDKHKNRAKISLNFLGQVRTIDVGIEILQDS